MHRINILKHRQMILVKTVLLEMEVDWNQAVFSNGIPSLRHKQLEECTRILDNRILADWHQERMFILKQCSDKPYRCKQHNPCSSIWYFHISFRLSLVFYWQVANFQNYRKYIIRKDQTRLANDLQNLEGCRRFHFYKM